MGDKEPPPPEPSSTERQPIQINGASDVDLVYADLGGRFRTAHGIGAVPTASRQVVRVIDPLPPAQQTDDDDRVHVVDLTRPDADGGFTTTLMTPIAFESRALAHLPPGLASRIPLPTGVPQTTSQAAEPTEHDTVFVYGTSWCAACKEATAFLRSRMVAVAFINVELDPGGAETMAAKLARLGLVADRVPVIDVYGRLLVGFEQRRLEALLGARL